MNLRKEQEKLAVLLEITDAPKKNSEIIRGAESHLIMDEDYNRLLSDKKTTAGKKELQFILYFLKRDNVVNVEDRGFYSANAATATELIKTAHTINDALKADEKTPCILTSDAVEEMELILSTHPILVIPSEVPAGFDVIGSENSSEAENTEIEGESKRKEEIPTLAVQVDKNDKPNKKEKKKAKKKANLEKANEVSDNEIDTEENLLPTDKNDKNDIF